MKKQERIKELYFDEKYKQKDIASLLNLSSQYVSKVLLQDSRYKKEKERRKKISKQKHKQKTVDYIKNKRKSDIDVGYEQLKQMHIQASQELSSPRRMNNRAFRDWNSSIYKYNYKTKSYNLKKGIVTGNDVPKKINWKSY